MLERFRTLRIFSSNPGANHPSCFFILITIFHKNTPFTGLSSKGAIYQISNTAGIFLVS